MIKTELNKVKSCCWHFYVCQCLLCLSAADFIKVSHYNCEWQCLITKVKELLIKEGSNTSQRNLEKKFGKERTNFFEKNHIWMK
jgi:hypothetical protein